jgi:hypothetical protein
VRAAAGRRFGFTPQEWRALRALASPAGIQKALEAMPYHIATTAWSPRRVLREGTAHCLEGAVFAAAALRTLGFPPLLLDLEAVQDSDHVIAVYRPAGPSGSRTSPVLRFREPVYRSVRELVMSYFESYMNLRGELTLRAYSQPVDLGRFDRMHPGWMTTEDDVWWIPEHLVGVPHTRLLTAAMTRSLSRVDRRSLAAGLVGYRKH